MAAHFRARIRPEGLSSHPDAVAQSVRTADGGGLGVMDGDGSGGFTAVGS